MYRSDSARVKLSTVTGTLSAADATPPHKASTQDTTAHLFILSFWRGHCVPTLDHVARLGKSCLHGMSAFVTQAVRGLAPLFQLFQKFVICTNTKAINP